jgi:hypothetical protein
MSRIRMAAGFFVELLGQRCFSSRSFLFLAIVLLAPLSLLHAQTIYEGNALEGTAVSESCSGCLNGTRIGNIGNGNANYLRIKNISVPTRLATTIRHQDYLHWKSSPSQRHKPWPPMPTATAGWV